MLDIKLGTISASSDGSTFDCEERVIAFAVQKCWEGSFLSQSLNLSLSLFLYPSNPMSCYPSIPLFQSLSLTRQEELVIWLVNFGKTLGKSNFPLQDSHFAIVCPPGEKYILDLQLHRKHS